MSATNRGSDYAPLAAYYTTLPLARFLIGLLPIWDRPRRILEPHVGSGNFLQAIIEREGQGGVYHRLLAMDADPAAKGIDLARAEGGWAAIGDFLTTPLPARPDVVLGNPPYSIPQPDAECSRCEGTGTEWRDTPRPKGWRRDPETERWFRSCPRCKGAGTFPQKPIAVAAQHIERALDVVPPGGCVAFLLRLGILEGRDRFELWQRHPPKHIYALSTRPIFTGTSSDQTSYGLFQWEAGFAGPTTISVVDWNPA